MLNYYWLQQNWDIFKHTQIKTTLQLHTKIKSKKPTEVQSPKMINVVENKSLSGVLLVYQGKTAECSQFAGMETVNISVN